MGLSGNECALCKCKLVRKEDSNTNVGEECHISSEKPDWPSKEFSRYEPSLEDDKRNKNIDNAILLCANCHKIIDNPENTQCTIEELHQIKEKHEAEVKTWVNKSKDTKLEQERDKKRIYNWLYNETKAYKDLTVGGYIVGGYTSGTLTDPKWRSTEEIASHINLTVERVEKLCFLNKKLKKMTIDVVTNGKENIDERDLKLWAIKEFVRAYVS